jgi:hypothetical protein
MATIQRTMACLALIVLTLPAQGFSAMAQSDKDRSQVDVSALRGHYTDMNDPGSGGSPLPPPPAAIDPKGLDTLAQLCQQLKAIGAAPSNCK